MSEEALIFGLRILFSLILYTFVGLAFWIIWRELEPAKTQSDLQTRDRADLIVITPGETGLLPGDRLPLVPLTTLGRALTNTIVLADSFVSAEHAQLTRRDGRWWLEDLGSANGTLLNEVRIQPGKATAIVEGDLVGVGGLCLRIQL